MKEGVFMTEEELFSPFVIFFDWARTYCIHLADFHLTFFEFWLWEILAVVIFAGVKFFLDN